MTEFNSILVANRGEIALRIMRTARAMGMTCVAVYTEADAGSPHVSFADRAICIGTGPVGDSYLDASKVLAAAQEAGAQAVHPGYGFLSENAEFARACTAAGLTFIGPSAESIALMGNKAAAKRRMIEAGVPCVPGYEGTDQSPAVLAAEAAGIGYPVMIKAAAGGGGRGMRLVTAPEGFASALDLAKSEALSAFGSDEMILEKAVMRPRHVEIQIFADASGNTIHLGERDCSVQRRHQKVVEEAPCPVMTPELRAEMGAAAVAAARAVSYLGAGTVEFLLDADGAFYFLEMNTRLQVEHPVTEMVTGLDLVALQIRAARGQALGLAQHDVALTGHAIEVRLYAEDASQGFLPQSGGISLWQPPSGPGIRVDAGITSGQEVSAFYDPMLAKLIAHGSTRGEALERLIAALRDTVIFGPACNRDFLIDVLGHGDFATGAATTGFISDHFDPLLPPEVTSADLALAAGLIYRADQAAMAQQATIPADLLGWSSQGALQARMVLEAGGDPVTVQLRQGRDGIRVLVGAAEHHLDHQGDCLRLDGLRLDLRRHLMVGEDLYLATGARILKVTRVLADQGAAAAAGGGATRAPMHGNLLDLSVSPGDRVEIGTRLAVLEAMKMQHEILAEVAGTVSEVAVTAPNQVKAGDLLVQIEQDSAKQEGTT
ncbi:acetyl/propionyl/methylcrotonyl-CoA carboxylase subunit alpha [Pseudophaeobacter sp. TrK17]|uniref:acetyl/propionyl/methylcrotonyl-CoA carboxylase subunit alpha n=1 Tax=Pseudophaeobacter sp. TrK17 TaxID=2815167 RepID=UPI0035D1292A